MSISLLLALCSIRYGYEIVWLLDNLFVVLLNNCCLYFLTLLGSYIGALELDHQFKSDNKCKSMAELAIFQKLIV